MKILIAEDNLPMRAVLRQFCATPADEVFECANGQEAVQAFGRHRPDFVLMDLMMPGLDGLEATAQIKTAHPEARIIIVSQQPAAQFRQPALQAGALEYVNKDDLQPLRQLRSAI